MNLLLVLGLLGIALGLSLGVLGGLVRSPPPPATEQTDTGGERTEAAATIADGGSAATDGRTGHASTATGDFVFPASDAEGGFVFASSGRSGTRVATHRSRPSDGRIPRARTTEETTSAPTDPAATRAINIFTEREEWITAWKQTVNTESTYHDTTTGEDVDFNETILFVIEPDAAYDTARQSTDDNISDGIAFVAELADGAGHSATTIPVNDRDQYEDGFTVHGPYATWKSLITQEIGLLDGLLSGRLAVKGDMQTLLRWSDGIAALTSSAGRVETIFPDEDETA